MIGAPTQAKTFSYTCQYCGDNDHWTKDCPDPHRFYMRYYSTDELRKVLNDKEKSECPTPLGLPGDKNEEPTPKDVPPLDSPETGDNIPSADTEESSPSQKLSSNFINHLSGAMLVSSSIIHCFNIFRIRASSRRFFREGVIVRGPPSCPLFHFYPAPCIPTNRPVDPPPVPPPL